MYWICYFMDRVIQDWQVNIKKFSFLRCLFVYLCKHIKLCLYCALRYSYILVDRLKFCWRCPVGYIAGRNSCCGIFWKHKIMQSFNFSKVLVFVMINKIVLWFIIEQSHRPTSDEYDNQGLFHCWDFGKSKNYIYLFNYVCFSFI